MEILILVILLLGTSCKTTKVEIKREILDLDFPSFPLIDAEYLEDENKVKIPLDDFIELAKFKVDYDGLKEYYEKVSVLVGSEKK